MMRPIGISVVGTLFAALCLACDDGGGGGAGDAGTDTDTDTDDCTAVEWGDLTDFTEGIPVGNWIHNGYIDGDQDGFVEEAEVEFSLEQIHCAGYESIVLMVGDTT
jgi:hypothetical protein